MSEELLHRLRELEKGYPDQPPFVQKSDLREINELRAQLGMPQVDSQLRTAADKKEQTPTEDPGRAEPEPPAVEDEHQQAREIYYAYLRKRRVLEVHREYARQVIDATTGSGQTPVRPLATLGTGGGPLLCDHCQEAIPLEGGRFHGVEAHIAWNENPDADWRSWILGGLVVERQTNGTVRIYHGYPNRDPNACCNIASREDAEQRAAFDNSQRKGKLTMMRAFLDDEFPDMPDEEKKTLISDLISTLYDYDPGLGVNRPAVDA